MTTYKGREEDERGSVQRDSRGTSEIKGEPLARGPIENPRSDHTRIPLSTKTQKNENKKTRTGKRNRGTNDGGGLKREIFFPSVRVRVPSATSFPVHPLSSSSPRPVISLPHSLSCFTFTLTLPAPLPLAACLFPPLFRPSSFPVSPHLSPKKFVQPALSYIHPPPKLEVLPAPAPAHYLYISIFLSISLFLYFYRSGYPPESSC